MIAAEWLRALRGKRSQAAFSRRLGYRSNIAARWESRRCFPTAHSALMAAGKSGLDVRACLRGFFRIDRPWIDALDPTAPEFVVALLGDLRGGVSILDIARASGFSRFSVARWLKGSAHPRLPEFFQLVEVLSLRMLDLVAAFVDPAKLPSIATAWRRRSAARGAAYERPWSHAVLRALELEKYRRNPAHDTRYLANRLGISAREVARSIDLLDRAGQIRRVGGLWQPTDQSAVDLRSEESRLRELKAFWLGVAKGRLEAGAPGTFGFNVFACSQADLVAVREMHLQYYQQAQALIARSEPSECVALFSTQLVRLDRDVG